MSEFMFGGERTFKKRISEREVNKRNRIAQEVAGRCAGFTQIKEPTGFFLSWFSIPNLGDPFDQIRANEILEKCGLAKI